MWGDGDVVGGGEAGAGASEPDVAPHAVANLISADVRPDGADGSSKVHAGADGEGAPGEELHFSFLFHNVHLVDA